MESRQVGQLPVISISEPHKEEAMAGALALCLRSGTCAPARWRLLPPAPAWGRGRRRQPRGRVMAHTVHGRRRGRKAACESQANRID